jgi:hypothetical protein
VFGGLWEAAVKSTKFHLKRILGSRVLNYEQFYTVLVEIEQILNSRPLVQMSNDIEDFSYLTPGHFIAGEALTGIPEQSLSKIPENRLQFWQNCTVMKERFWKDWYKQYLNQLQSRPKWKETLPNVCKGSLVILKECDGPSFAWPMARVTDIYPGKDGCVRALEVTKSDGKSHRTSITKVCVLPLE